MSVFLDLPEERVLLRTEHFFVIEDGFPVAPGHLLIISNHSCPDWFSLTPEEQGALPAVLDLARKPGSRSATSRTATTWG